MTRSRHDGDSVVAPLNVGGGIAHDYEALVTAAIPSSSSLSSKVDNERPVVNGGRSSSLSSSLSSSRKWSFGEPSPSPPLLPRALRLWTLENVAIPLCYFVVGSLQGLSGPFLNAYPLDLGATEAQQTTIMSLWRSAASFKIAFGFLSDSVPLWGYRRKSHMFVGWTVTSLGMIVLMVCSDLSSVANGAASERAPSMFLLSGTVFVFGTGMWFADVMADSVVAEKAKLEPEGSRGELQSTCYACRFLGQMIAAPCSTILYDRAGPRAVATIMALLPVLLLPAVCVLAEQRDAHVQVTKDRCREMWTTVCSRAVWQPMGFVWAYNVLQIGNAAWKQYLRTVLGFSDAELNTLLVISYALLYVGVIAYKYYFIRWSWRSVYVFTTMLNSVLSALQLLLVKGVTFGMSPFCFALGDDALGDLLEGIQFLPITIMMVHLCPDGSEGASYAMFTTVSNSGIIMSEALSTVLLGVWDVSKDALAAGDLSGLVKLTVLTTLLQTSGLLLIGLLPRDATELSLLRDDDHDNDHRRRGRVGGAIFLSVLFGSLSYALVVEVMNVVRPGWMGESR